MEKENETPEEELKRILAYYDSDVIPFTKITGSRVIEKEKDGWPMKLEIAETDIVDICMFYSNGVMSRIFFFNRKNEE